MISTGLRGPGASRSRTSRGPRAERSADRPSDRPADHSATAPSTHGHVSAPTTSATAPTGAATANSAPSQRAGPRRDNAHHTPTAISANAATPTPTTSAPRSPAPAASTPTAAVPHPIAARASHFARTTSPIHRR
ncbi:hypothetical protein ACIHEI_21450 [Kitasatospora sp. NPDC051984]|uniref:hypothetical protein n=1 Tax=Kitasatospora sp. NPDC051984 TaxID=3364059 RepID=UPI0037CAE01E